MNYARPYPLIKDLNETPTIDEAAYEFERWFERYAPVIDRATRKRAETLRDKLSAAAVAAINAQDGANG
jgi:hypothetical protein